MFVSRAYDQSIIGTFLTKKYAALTAYNGLPETTSMYYSKDDLTSVIEAITETPNAKGVRFFPACYAGGTGVEQLEALFSQYGPALTIVFGAIDINGVNIGGKYFICPGGGVLNLIDNQASALTNSYMGTPGNPGKRDFLQALVQAEGLSNFHETRSLSLWLESWTGPRGFLAEIDCQGAAGISAFWGTYPMNFTLPDPPARVDMQLTLVFEITGIANINGNDYLYTIDLEDSPVYNDRKAITPGLRGGDTVNPCPPAVC